MFCSKSARIICLLSCERICTCSCGNPNAVSGGSIQIETRGALLSLCNGTHARYRLGRAAKSPELTVTVRMVSSPGATHLSLSRRKKSREFEINLSGGDLYGDLRDSHSLGSCVPRERAGFQECVVLCSPIAEFQRRLLPGGSGSCAVISIDSCVVLLPYP